MKHYWAGVFGLFVLIAGPVQAIDIDEFERRDYDLTASTTPAHFTPPSSRHRLFFEVFNITDFYDYETNNTHGWVDGTWFADTLRPTATILWDERIRAQIGLVARKTYGQSDDFGSVDPWIQLLWQPIKPLNVVLGNLNTPHYYHDALFMPLNYVRESPVETGAQLLLKKENWYDDAYFNYRLEDTPEHNEKFDMGFIHHNAWKFLHFKYQAHWIHEGGTINLHPIATINDVAQLFSGGVQFRPAHRWIVGARYSYLTSRRHHETGSHTHFYDSHGNGKLYEAYTRWNRLKISYEHWRSQTYEHEGSDPWYELPILDLVTVRWDILLAKEFNVYLRYTGGMPGPNDQGAAKYLKSAIHLQTTWQFSIPVFEWTTPSVASEGDPVSTRWDDGV